MTRRRPSGGGARPRRPVRLVVAGLAAVLVAAGLSACGSRTDDYCSTLRDDQQTLQRLAAGKGEPGTDPVHGTLEVFTSLRDKAPEDVTDEWDTMVYAWQTLADALDRAGVDPSTYRAGSRPPGVTPAQQKAIAQAAAELSSARVLDAGRGIEQHALDVCKVDLGQGPVG